MKQLLIFFFTMTLFTACNNNSGWTTAERQKGLKACMDETAGKLDDATAKKFCSCALEKAMRQWKTYAESENAPDDDPAGVEIGRSCLAAIQGGNDPEEGKKKGGGLFGGGGWSKSDKNTFSTQCQQNIEATGYSEGKARQLCDCILKKIEKKYSSLDDANEKGGEAAGTKARQECEEGGNDDGNGNNDDN